MVASSAAVVEERVLHLNRPRASLPLVILCVLAVITAMYFAREIAVPIFLAILLALLLKPVMRQLQHWHVPNMASALALTCCTVILFLAGVITLAGQAQQWLKDAPGIVRRAAALIPVEQGPLSHWHEATAAIKSLTKSEGEQEPLKVIVEDQEMPLVALGVSTHFAGAAVIVFVLAFFLLWFHDSLLNQVVQCCHSFDEKRNVVQLMRNVESGISRYLITVTIINACLGIATACLLWLMNIPNPILWGVMAATMNYVPHVGAFVCMAVLFLVGSVTHESLGYGVLIASLFALLTALESYLITPLVLSRSLHLSPLAIILAILFFGWLWGIAGGLMAAPLLALLKITCDQFPSLKGWAEFLSGGAQQQAAPAS